MSRSFTIEAVYKDKTKLRYDGGRYISSTPMAAAKKAFTNVYNSLNAKGKMTLTIHMRETTMDSNKKIYKYKVSKVKEIKTVERDGVMITYNFSTKIKSI